MKTILVIEDELSLREDIIDILQLADFQVIGATDGVVGVDYALHYQPDLIICDIMMPRQTGDEVLRQVRANAATVVTPFIFLTAKSHRNDIRYHMELGADDYISKPFTPDELLRAVHTQFEKQQTLAKDHERRLDDLRRNIIRALPHELRTPLTVILGHTRMLIEDCDSFPRSEVLQMASSMQRSALRMNRLIENHLIYAQLELLETNVHHLDTSLVTHDLPQLLASLIQQRGSEARRLNDMHSDCQPVTLAISREDLCKILYELLDNALKFSNPGSPVQVIGRLLNQRQYQLSVIDQGRGMSVTQKEEIGAYMQFERRFYEHPGLGLGLTIAIRLVELYGGTLDIESAPGNTQVCITLPCTEA